VKDAINVWVHEQPPVTKAQTVKPVMVDRSVQTTGAAVSVPEYGELLRDILNR
jgi:hypothetical protein